MSEEKKLLVPTDVYLKSGVHIGTKFKTKYMEPYIFKIRPDGLAILNLSKIDEKLKEAAKYLAQYNPEDILVVARRETSWKGATLFKKSTGINVITGRYPPGLLTNTNLEEFKEPKILFAVDPWPDRNAIKDAKRMNILVVAFCDTNNTTQTIDFVIPLNNKGRKSVGLAFYILAKEYLKEKGLIQKDEEIPYTIEDFISEE